MGERRSTQGRSFWLIPAAAGVRLEVLQGHWLQCSNEDWCMRFMDAASTRYSRKKRSRALAEVQTRQREISSASVFLPKSGAPMVPTVLGTDFGGFRSTGGRFFHSKSLGHGSHALKKTLILRVLRHASVG